jgi:ATPase subunit of ABC transporter with duplicated ATPase domains
VVVVSHDRHFVSSLVDRVVELGPAEDGDVRYTKVKDFGGTYEEFLEREGREYLRK